MKKYLAILFSVLIVFGFSSCDYYRNIQTELQKQETSVSEPVQESGIDTVSDISQTSKIESSFKEKSQENQSYYVLNTNTKKIHLPSCRSAHRIAEKNYATTDDLQAALDEGYEKCKNCNPQ